MAERTARGLGETRARAGRRTEAGGEVAGDGSRHRPRRASRRRGDARARGATRRADRGGASAEGDDGDDDGQQVD